MFENYQGLSIQGGCFRERTSLDFFDNKDQRFSLIFGRNGSGKSTVARAFRILANNEDDPSISGSISFFNGNPINIGNQSGTTNLFVFDERYIDEHVKIEDDGLHAIVLLGEQIGLEASIKDINSKIALAAQAVEQAKCRWDEYIDARSTKSPQYHYKDIEKKLKVDGGWAATDSLIKGNTVKSAVTETLISELLSLSTEKTLQELTDEFEQKSDLLKKTRGIGLDTIPKVPILSSYAEDEEKVIRLLAKEVKQSQLTEREQLIFDIALKLGTGHIETVRDTFSVDDTEVCPYCFRPVTKEYKHDLTEAIDRVLNKDANEHKEELSYRLPIINLAVTPFISIDADTVAHIQEKVLVCNGLIGRYNDALAKKAENIYTPILFESLELESEVQTVISLLSILADCRADLINATNDRKNLLYELIQLNKQIAAKRLKSEFRAYSKQTAEQKKAESEYKRVEKELKQLEKQKKDLEAQKNNIIIAIDTINKALQYVFLSETRLSIQLENEQYCLLSNGRSVLPKDVSLGERNIIALCYFFTEIMKMHSVKDFYKQEMLIVIDDPVSSFDFDNRVGIISYLKSQFMAIALGNNNSKVIVLSHDLSTVYDLSSAMGDIAKATSSRAGVNKSNVSQKELFGQKLIPWSMKLGEYSQLVDSIYHYANGELVDAYDVTIGNTMRRALEAFSTFLYKKGMSNMAIDQDILNELKPKAKYFECLMYRLVLNGESHSQERVYSLNDDMHFYEHLSVEEKRKTAKDVLCMMFILQPMHVKANLPNVRNAERTIKAWIDAIPDD